MIKTLKKVVRERNVLNLIKGLYENLTANVIPVEDWMLSSKIRKKTRMSPLTVNIILEGLAREMRQEK